MATDIPTKEPIQIRSGETIQWTREDLTSDYPASTWTLTYYLVKAASTSAQYTVSATADGDYFDVTIPAATSANYSPGTYSILGRVSKSGEVFNVYDSMVAILPDIGATLTTGYDTRSDAKKMLDAIEAMMYGRATDEQIDVVSKTIGDKNLARNPELLLKFRDIYKKEVIAENMASGLSGPRRIGVRLTRI